MSLEQGQRILKCLQAAVDSNRENIRAAEAQLLLEAEQPGYGLVLARIALATHDVAPDLRLVAAVLLKQYVKQHWVEGERGFVAPETPEQEKQQIRAALPAGLQDPDSKIRTAVGVVIATIANWDWPQAWPGLLEYIVNCIKQQEEPNLLMGSLGCLSVMASDLDNDSAPQLVQVLSPELCSLVSNPATPKTLSATCFEITAELVGSLAALSGTFQRQVRSILVPIMAPWVQLVCSALNTDMKVKEGWRVKMAALQLSQPLVTYFSKPLESCMPALMGASWQLLLAAQPLHQSMLVEGQDGGEQADGDEEQTPLQSLLAQLFELLLAFVGPARFSKQLEAALPQMVYVAITYMQMTQDQAEQWADDANMYLADEEEDIISCRASADLWLQELVDQFDASALRALLDAAQRRLMEADAAAAAGVAAWWQLREATLCALGSCSEKLISGAADGTLPALQLQQLLDNLVQRELQPLLQGQAGQQVQLGGDGQLFLVGRALRLCAQLREAATPQQQDALLQAASTAVVCVSSAPVQVNAFRALGMLCPCVPPQQLQPHLQPLLGALVQLLKAADEESLHLVLEVLETLLLAAGRAPEGLAPDQAMAVAQPVLQAWASHTADPLIGPDAQSVIAAIASQPACLHSLAAAAAPTLAGIISRGAAASQAQQHGAAAGSAEQGGSSMLVEASLDMLGTMIQPGQPAVALELAKGVLGPVLSLVAVSDDSSQLKSAVTLLLQLLRVCPTADLLSIDTGFGQGTNSSAGDRLLLQLLLAARHLLSPQQPDSCTGIAGPLLSQLVKSFPNQLAAKAPAELAGGDPGATTCLGLLLRDTAAKMASGKCSPATIAGLLEFVVKLALLDAAHLVELLAGLQVQQSKDGTVSSTTGLSVVLPLWLDHASDVSGALLTRQCAAALLQLLQLRHHPALSGLTVAGSLIEEPGAAGGGRVTRSKARQQGGLRYSQVPATAKVLQVLGQLLSADQEAADQKFSLEGEESDWEDEYETADEGEGGPDSSFSSPAGIKLEGVAIKGLPGGVAGRELFSEDILNRSSATTPVPEDPSDANDPLLRMSIRSLLRQGLSNLVRADPAFMTAAAAAVGPGRELQALQDLLNPIAADASH